MASTALIIGGLAVAGGVGYLIYRALTQTACDKTCTSLGDPGGHSVCVAACNLAGQGGGIVKGVGDYINNNLLPGHDSNDPATWNDALTQRDATNVAINGPAIVVNSYTVLNDSSPSYLGAGGDYFSHQGIALAGPTLRHANGCVPFFGAPDWAKCGPGTLDMIASAIGAAIPHGIDDFNTSEDHNIVQLSYLNTNEYLTSGNGSCAPDGAQDDKSEIWPLTPYAGLRYGEAFYAIDRDEGRWWGPCSGGCGDGSAAGGASNPDATNPLRCTIMNKAHTMTGQSRDGATYGPMKDPPKGTDANGAIIPADNQNPYWWIMGQKTYCAPGTTPKAVVLQRFGDVAAQSQADAVLCVDPKIDPRPTSVQVKTGTTVSSGGSFEVPTTTPGTGSTISTSVGQGLRLEL